MMMLLPTKEPQPPFHGPGGNSFYCRFCRAYTNNFWKSFVKHGTRACRDCYSVRRKPAPTGAIPKLRRSLYKTLHGQGHRDLAKALTDESVWAILKSHDIADPEAVRAIRPPKSQDEFMKPNMYKLKMAVDL